MTVACFGMGLHAFRARGQRGARRGWRALTLAVCLLFGGCRARPSPPAEPLPAILPASAQTLLSFDVQAIRRSPLWQAVSLAMQRRAAHAQLFAEVRARTGFDPLEDLQRVVVAFPEAARRSGEFALVLVADHADERRLVAYARDEASTRGQDIRQEEHAGRRLWVEQGPPRRAGFFLDRRTFVLGGGGWGHLMAETASSAGEPRDGPAGSGELWNLFHKLPRASAVRAVAVVPGSTRTQLAADSRLRAASSIARLALSLALDTGVEAHLRIETSSREAAQALGGQVERFMRDARQSPQVLLAGVGPWLEQVDIEAEGPTLHLSLRLTVAQTQTLSERIAVLVRHLASPP